MLPRSIHTDTVSDEQDNVVDFLWVTAHHFPWANNSSLVKLVKQSTQEHQTGSENNLIERNGERKEGNRDVSSKTFGKKWEKMANGTARNQNLEP